MARDRNMIIRTYLDNIYKYVNNVCEYETRYYNIDPNYVVSTLFIDNLTNSYEEFIRQALSTIGLNGDIYNYQKVYNALIVLVLLQDTYIKCNYLLYSGKGTDDIEKLHALVSKAIDDKSINFILNNKSRMLTLINNSLEILNASAIKKIAYLSSLDEENKTKLENFNPFFKEEYGHYDVVLDKVFFLRQIRNWLKIADENKTFEEMAKFIIDMRYLDSDRIDIIFELIQAYTTEEDLINYISNEDVDNLSRLIKQFYNDNKEIQLKR